MSYRHTQTATSMYLIGLLGLGGAVVVGLAQPFDTAGNIVFEVAGLLLVLVGLVAARLTATLDDQEVSVWFGWGWPRRTIDLDRILGARQVRNSWWYGWGLRKIRHGWMFNNAGRDAVELQLEAGRVFRIGTDEPDVLLAAVQDALDRRRNRT